MGEKMGSIPVNTEETMVGSDSATSTNFTLPYNSGCGAAW